MSIQDPIADMMTCIRNAQMMGIKQTYTPFSKLKGNLLRVLKEEGYIHDFQVVSADNKQNIQIILKYFQGKPVIEKFKRVSRPALRVYRGCDDIPLVRGGLGISILSTPKGVMTDKRARTERIGGEILCTVE
ncbi:MAG: 30S ribosomal protein S8 [Gammaproteobacteria bacterium RIFCSPHIGHO2_12_FULL_42_10]|nr:MAG: 30S ribosomal protein S8 [Gammaproteobacteria bacterium RIFCSPHIGHO2_12_FULL_42_10]